MELMNVILSIRPNHFASIKDGQKLYEFRKVTFRQSVEFAYLYATSPINKIMGKFRVGEIVSGHPNELWASFREVSGVNEVDFFSYFEHSHLGYAIKIEDLQLFDFPIEPKKCILNFTPPQSFRYTDIVI